MRIILTEQQLGSVLDSMLDDIFKGYEVVFKENGRNIYVNGKLMATLEANKGSLSADIYHDLKDNLFYDSDKDLKLAISDWVDKTFGVKKGGFKYGISFKKLHGDEKDIPKKPRPRDPRGAEKGFDIKDAKIIPTLTGDSRDITTKKFIEILEEEFKKADYKIGLFGIGADGHTAGILPNSVATESKDLACGYDTELFSRITLTFRAIEKLDEVVAFAQGEEKWEVLDDLQKKDIDVKVQPAQILKKVPVLTIFTDYKKV